MLFFLKWNKMFSKIRGEKRKKQMLKFLFHSPETQSINTTFRQFGFQLYDYILPREMNT